MLTRKRASLLLTATADYGAFAEVFALFVVHTAFDDELHSLLLLMARQKQLGQTLGHMEAVKAELEPAAVGGIRADEGSVRPRLAFERAMVALLRADAVLPQAQRVWLKGFIQPRIEVHVGVSKPGMTGIRYADMLIIEERPATGQPPRVETFSFKSRNLAQLKPDPLREQIWVDARAALEYYGGTLDILRSSLKRRVQVQRVRLVYEGGELKPRELDVLRQGLDEVKKRIQGVEVLFQ